jgi:hypothetical protein
MSIFKIKVFSLKFFLLSFALVFFLTLLELFFQLTSTEKEDNFANTQEWQKKYAVHNSHGYRDKEHSFEKPENVFRILVLGDSQTFGHGIKKIENTWHKKLEVLMNQGTEKNRFEIISLAGEGWNTDTQLYELFKAGFNYNPDLILLGFYHNDIFASIDFQCDSADIPLFPGSKSIQFLRNSSKLFKFVEFRVNRLLEEMGRKPKFTDCINKRFESGWPINETFLDTILLSARMKNVSFMITMIPLIHKLGEDYPLLKSHALLKKYCADRGIEYLDLYENGFMGLNAEKLIISRSDRHLNEKGSEIVAQTLYKKLNPLKEYENLPYFRGLFDLAELLNRDDIVRKFDQNYLELIKQKESHLFNKALTINLEIKNDLLSVKKIILDNNLKFIKNIVLTKDGNFKEKSIEVRNDLKGLVYEENVKDMGFFQLRKSLKANNSTNYFFENDFSEFLFSYVSRDTGVVLFTEKKIKFKNLKSFERLIVGSAYAATEKQIADKLFFYLRYGWVNQVENLILKILKSNPSEGALKAIEKTRPMIKVVKKIKALQKKYKSFFYGFVPLEAINPNQLNHSLVD